MRKLLNKFGYYTKEQIREDINEIPLFEGFSVYTKGNDKIVIINQSSKHVYIGDAE